jgi:hypothetical protein
MHSDFSAAKLERKVCKLREYIRYVFQKSQIVGSCDHCDNELQI